MENSQLQEPLAAARFIKVIGRGKDGARSMNRDDACLLYGAMLDGRISDLELGAVLLSMRIKGESIDEIAGFLDAAEASFAPLSAPADGQYAPIVIPSYNGARKLPNLTPLLAILLARQGAPVLVHGVLQDAGRVTTAEIFAALDMPVAQSIAEAEGRFLQHAPAFLPIDVLAPKMARLLSLRRILGVRSSTHTLVKIIQPFQEPVLRLSSYTHSEYLDMLGRYFTTLAPAQRGDVFLMRGTEGETVASVKRAQSIDWFHEGQRTTLVEKQLVADAAPDVPVERDAQTTALWIRRVLAGELPVPAAISEQVTQCLQVAKMVRERRAVECTVD
ncbi:DNA-binding protein YbiB [Actimicrobium sp. CCI2.3]|uniref:DNA-binding protein YbiB n=1 Tax=Actimicrobium sp. CCI2.3 TaxID=3048616 RepID=UPI002AB4A79C|nr:DNA-binding protein YbiB [Actimicrobium sp. CCI2.3]MDY7576144.1 DNA-binding protein YbiB [Actimicrobium sp. CCI2.3]MEB0023454.1 DNA-binding protein YbiB [Actimicrobium sp. CCI2.3]